MLYFLVFTFLIFVGVSSTVLSSFARDVHIEAEGGGCFLMFDYTTRCDTQVFRSFIRPYAIVSIFIYPLGIPAM